MNVQMNNLHEDLIKELNRYDVCPLYEHKDSTILYEIPDKLKSQGGVDLRGTKIRSARDIAQLCKMYRDSRYETFRIIFIKDGEVVGSQGITTKLPGIAWAVPYFKNDSEGIALMKRTFLHFKSIMERTGADGYYMVHNHPSGNVIPSTADLNTTVTYIKNLDGFLGHIILGEDSYTIIDNLLNDQTYPLPNTEKLKREITTQVHNRDDLQGILAQFPDSDTSSVLVYVGGGGYVAAVEDLKNSAFNDMTVLRYIQKQKTEFGALRVYLFTNNSKVYGAGLIGRHTNVLSDVLYDAGDSCVDSSDLPGNYEKFIKNDNDVRRFNVN